MSRNATRNRRKPREEVKPQAKEKFLEVAREKVQARAITPLNDRQAEYFEAIKDKDLVVATGYAGTSKTFVACCFAADAYAAGLANRIVLARPAMSGSASLGFNKGDMNEKMKQWVMPMLSVLYSRLGKDVVDLAIIDGNIALQPLESIKGMSYPRGTWVIADECEDCEEGEIKSIVTRNAGCKMILCGDVTQSCLKKSSGLVTLMNIIKSDENVSEHAALIDFNEYAHIVRSKLCKSLIIAYDKYK